LVVEKANSSLSPSRFLVMEIVVFVRVNLWFVFAKLDISL
jgi:hypothetical protein